MIRRRIYNVFDPRAGRSAIARRDQLRRNRREMAFAPAAEIPPEAISGDDHRAVRSQMYSIFNIVRSICTESHQKAIIPLERFKTQFRETRDTYRRGR